jgi:hypothetical protein
MLQLLLILLLAAVAAYRNRCLRVAHNTLARDVLIMIGNVQCSNICYP